MHPDDLRLDPTHGGDGRVQLRWLGTAGFEIRAGEHVILVDPYLTRVGLWRYLTGAIRPDAARIEAAGITRADAIFVGHSHFDHVMDVPYLAQKTGAKVYGSRSTANLMACSGLPESQFVACTGETTVEVGPFKVTLIPSEHSRFALGHKVPYAGDIPCSCELPIRGKDYKCGDVFGLAIEVDGLTLYHQGSANLIEDAIRHKDVDLFLMGISGRHATERYIPRILKHLTPRMVVPTHYDDFFRAADAPMRLLPLTKFGRFYDDVQGFDRQIRVGTLGIGQTLSLP